jgi:peptidoglycan/xylan/chitin deacetylase (PgdA/CDA1 family)
MPNGTPAAIGTYASIGFETLPTELHPSYIPNNMIIPTFDDVPEGAVGVMDPIYGFGSWTKQDLQLFDGYGMHVDFFINTNNWCGDVTQSPECTQDIMDILTLHNPANHTVYHPHMGAPNTGNNGCDNVTDCTSEITGVETVINTLSNGARPHLTRFRMPYGEPEQNQGATCTSIGAAACVPMVEGVVAQYAVGVGWNMDSGDSAGATTGMVIATNVETLIGNAPGAGAWGIVLMHGTNPWTHDAIPLLYDPQNGYLAMHGFKTATVEDAICWKYGKHSWEIVTQISGNARSSN